MSYSHNTFPSISKDKILGWTDTVDEIAIRLSERLIEIRRHLHMYPEPSGEEIQTTKYLAEALQETGCPLRIGEDGRGVLVDCQDATPDIPFVAFRGDMDALWIQEMDGPEYKSRVDEVMHACGHDAHSACAVGTAMVLAEMANKKSFPWPVNWRGILQPSEEVSTGAREMIERGALEDVKAIFSLHMDPSHTMGTICVKEGAFSAACDEFSISLTGEGGHGARPHQTIDPIAAGALIISALYQQIPRLLDAQDTSVITVGQFSAGHSPNVIPETAEIKGTFRTLSPTNRDLVKQHVVNLVNGIAQTTGCRVEIDFPVGCPGVTNDSTLTQILRDAASSFPEGLTIRELNRSSMGGEDFAEYQQLVPGTMFRLGCHPANGCTTLHSPHFDIDERSLVLGVRMLAKAVILRSCPEFHYES